MTNKINFAFLPSHLRRFAFAAIVLAVVTVISASVFAWFEFSPRTGASPAIVAKAQATPKADPLIVELVTLTPDGFIPAAISHPKGKFLLVVDDRTSLAETQLTFERVVGNGKNEKIKDVKIKHSVPLWSEEQDLNPGDYQLSEINHPTWIFRLTVTPK